MSAEQDREEAVEAAQTFLDQCEAIAARTTGDNERIAFVASAGLIAAMRRRGNDAALLGLFKAVAGMSKLEGVTRSELIDCFKVVVKGVFNTPRLNQ